jgi:hypothetical protein
MNDTRVTRRSLLIGVLAATSLGAVGHLVSDRPDAVARAGKRTYPSWVSSSPRSLAAYQTALDQPELLAALRCYCGCERFEQPHASLRDCFVKPDGSLEAHASGCDVCRDQALDAGDWAAAGLSLAEIRRRTDERYGEL